jgi:hypothetical protein
MNAKKIERLINKSLDTDLSRKEAIQLNKELLQSEDLLKKYSQIESIREAISISTDAEFRPGFEERLIRKIQFIKKEKYYFTWSDSLVLSFRRIALTAVIVLIVLVSYNLSNGNKYSLESLLGINDTSIEHAYDPLQNLIRSDKQ